MAETRKPDILFENLDTTVSPRQDSFQYANGGWLKRNPIPNDQSSYGICNLVIEENLKRFREINEKAVAANAAKGTNDQKIGDFWKTAMDSAKAEQLGVKPLQPWFDKINAVTDIKSLVTTVAELKKQWDLLLCLPILLTRITGRVMQRPIRYGRAVSVCRKGNIISKMIPPPSISAMSMLTILRKSWYPSGEDSTLAKADAVNILALETKLAQASRKRELLRDDYKNYNKMAIADLPKLSPGIDWTSYLNITGVKGIDSVIVGQPEFFKTLDNVLQTNPIPLWKSYLKFNLISDFSAELPMPIVRKPFFLPSSLAVPKKEDQGGKE